MIEFEVVDGDTDSRPRGRYTELRKALLELEPGKQIKVPVKCMTSAIAHANLSRSFEGKTLHTRTHDGFIYLWLTDKK